MRPLIVRDNEAGVLTEQFLHCGVVQADDEWDTADAWSDPQVRAAARQMLIRYRDTRQLPSEDERRLLAVCCGG